MAISINGTTGISGVDGSASTPALQGNDSNTGISFGTDEVAINTGGTQRVLIDTSGNCGIGTSSPLYRLHLENTSVAEVGFNATGSGGGHWRLGTGHSVSGISGAFRFYDVTNAAERARITSGGAFLVGQTTSEAPGEDNTTRGACITSGGKLYVSNTSDYAASINRNTDDGILVALRQAGVAEGTISVSGTTVAYNGAHLSRWSQISGVDPRDKGSRPDILRGTVMTNLDEMCEWIDPESGDPQANEQLNKTKVSDTDDDPNVAGVFQSWDDDDDTWVNDYYLAMTGDFVIRIASDITVQRGDLLVSAGDGTARPQGDRYIKDSTIAKVTSTTVSHVHPDGSYCVPCVLMAC